MTDKPILLSGPMVRALLDGSKTQTRRVLKPQPSWMDCQFIDLHRPPLPAVFEDPDGVAADQHIKLLAGRGDRLWVREAWCGCWQMNAIPPRDFSKGDPIGYLADGEIRPRGCLMVAQGRTRASMHMPRWASRLTLVVTDVRVQRLQDISEMDAIAEGVQLYSGIDPECYGYLNYRNNSDDGYWIGAKESFRTLWDSINGPEAWDANPWVAAYSFTGHKCSIDQMEQAND